MTAHKLHTPNFDQMLEILRAHDFDVEPFAGVPGGFLVSKHGAGAVLVAAEGKDVPVAILEGPGALVGGEVALLLDRGYQKFFKTSKFELPASASQLQGVHLFSEELNQLTGGTSLYNQSLGTTSDIYEYDRLQGREAEEEAAVSPRERTSESSVARKSGGAGDGSGRKDGMPDRAGCGTPGYAAVRGERRSGSTAGGTRRLGEVPHC